MSEEVVTLPKADYEALLRDRAELQRLRGFTAGPVCLSPKARFSRDTELVGFLNQNALTMTVDQLWRAARERFGEDRAPARASVGRYMKRVRAEALDYSRR